MSMPLEQLVIEGGHPLCGTVVPSGNKNAAMPLLAASLLTDEVVTLHNVPEIGDVQTVIDLMLDLGMEIEGQGDHSMSVRAHYVSKSAPNAELFAQARGSVTLLGPMLARLGRVDLCSPGGDRIGRRRLDTHLLALESLGAEWIHNDRFTLKAGGLHGADILLDETSVTATENAIMAASLARGTTVIRNAASEPHVQDLCHCLNQMGAHITGIGSNTLTIEGVERLGGTEFTISPDYMEVGSFLGLGAVTPGEIRIHSVTPEHLRMICMVFGDRLGVRMRLEGSDLVIEGEQELRIRPDVGGAVPKIEDAPWPAFPTDLMSIALVVATQAQGTVLMHEKMYESRLYFVDRLIGMGAQIILCDPHRAVVVGPSRLQGQPLSSPDIRAGMALVIAALCAEGNSVIGNVGQIDRGYERLEDKLRALGAYVERR
jgi:UDP-N-acetylglucosamine 1-carboxyvinyltransferase